MRVSRIETRLHRREPNPKDYAEPGWSKALNDISVNLAALGALDLPAYGAGPARGFRALAEATGAGSCLSRL